MNVSVAVGVSVIMADGSDVSVWLGVVDAVKDGVADVVG